MSSRFRRRSRCGFANSSSSPSVGTRVPAYSSENQLPASRLLICSSVISRMRPLESVVRSTFPSCISTSFPSAV